VRNGSRRPSKLREDYVEQKQYGAFESEELRGEIDIDGRKGHAGLQYPNPANRNNEILSGEETELFQGGEIPITINVMFGDIKKDTTHSSGCGEKQLRMTQEGNIKVNF